MSKHRCRFIEQAFRLVGVAGREGERGQAAQRIAGARRDCERAELVNAANEPITGRAHVARGVFDVPEQVFSIRHHIPVAAAMGQRQGARQSSACALELPLRVPQHSRSYEGSQLGGGRKRTQIQDVFVPLEAFRRMPTDQPEVLQPPRDAGCFGGDGRAQSARSVRCGSSRDRHARDPTIRLARVPSSPSAARAASPVQ